jgi:hypothetical protein
VGRPLGLEKRREFGVAAIPTKSKRIAGWTLIIERHYKFTPLDDYQTGPILILGLLVHIT